MFVIVRKVTLQYKHKGLFAIVYRKQDLSRLTINSIMIVEHGRTYDFKSLLNTTVDRQIKSILSLLLILTSWDEEPTNTVFVVFQFLLELVVAVVACALGNQDAAIRAV